MERFLKYITFIEEAIENEKSEVIEDESCYKLYTPTYTSELKPLLDINFTDFFEYFGKSLRITIAPKSQTSTIFHYENGAEFFVGELKNYIEENEAINFIFNINKDDFIKEKINESAFKDNIVRIFKSQRSFADYFKYNTIFYLQKQFFVKDKRLYLIIPDLNCSYSNDIFNIIGNTNFEDISESMITDIRFDKFAVFKERINLRDKELRWEDKISFVTPEYFNFEGLSNNILKPLLDTKSTECLITFLADAVKEIDGKYICQFNGYKCAEIILDEVNINAWNSYKKVYPMVFDLYNWTYESNFSDKIMIVRNVISKYLKENNQVNYIEFLNNVEDILNVVKSNYSIFFQKKIDMFFEDRKKIVQYTFDKSKDVEKEISNLTDSMTKNILTAVGVILATIIANSARSNLSNISIKVAISAYLFYLLISVIFNIINPVISLIQQCRSNSHLIKYYTTFIPEGEIKRIQGNVFRNKLIYFWVYWGFSFLLIAFMIGFSIYAISNLQTLLNVLNVSK